MAIRRSNGRWIVALLPSGDWHPEEIKAAVRIQGSSFAELTRNGGLVVGACRIAAKRPHLDGETAIASFLGLDPSQIWPSRFRSDGSRIPRLSQHRKSSGTACVSLRQKEVAA